MSDASASAASTQPPGLLERHHFLLRRLHSLAGIVPIGVFVIFHLFTNAQIIWGALGFEDKFQHEVDFIHDLPALLYLEIFGLWLPIAFHAGLGFVYTFSGKSNVKHYKYGGNVRYTLQRVTGILAFVFIFLHIATLRWRLDVFGWFTPFYADAEFGGETVGLASASTAIAFNGGPDASIFVGILIVLFYAVGVMSAVFHWSNGLWTAAITWGVTTSVQSMRRWGYVCAVMFLALTAFTVTAIYGSVVYEPSTQELAAWMEKAGRTEQVAGFDPSLTSAAVELLKSEEGFTTTP